MIKFNETELPPFTIYPVKVQVQETGKE